jgi:uncharacterized membrane protein
MRVGLGVILLFAAMFGLAALIPVVIGAEHLHDAGRHPAAGLGFVLLCLLVSAFVVVVGAWTLRVLLRAQAKRQAGAIQRL